MQNMVLGLWTDREEVSKENKALIKELGFKFRGKNSWLSFESYKERCAPQFLTDEETALLADALGNLHLMLEAVFKKGLKVDFENGETIERSCNNSGMWLNRAASYKDISDVSITTKFPETDWLKKLSEKPSGKLVIELDERCLPIPMHNKNPKLDYFPLLISVADAKTGNIICTEQVLYDENREDVLFDVINEISEQYGKIKQIKINDELTRASLSDLCDKTGIKLTFQQKPLKHIEEFIEKLFFDAILDDAMLDGELLDDEPLDDEPLDDEPLDDEPLDDEPLDDEPKKNSKIIKMNKKKYNYICNIRFTWHRLLPPYKNIRRRNS